VAPGIPWAAVSTDGIIRFTIGEDPDDDRYLRSYVPASGFGEGRIACPEFTGSYLSIDGDHLYLSQWYKHRILKLDASGNILRAIDVGAEVSGHVFVDGSIYVLRGTEQGNEDWRIARLDPQQETPKVNDWRVFRSRAARLLSTARLSGRIIAPLTRSYRSRYHRSHWR